MPAWIACCADAEAGKEEMKVDTVSPVFVQPEPKDELAGREDPKPSADPVPSLFSSATVVQKEDQEDPHHAEPEDKKEPAPAPAKEDVVEKEPEPKGPAALGFTARLAVPKGRGVGAAFDAAEGAHLRIAKVEATGSIATYNAQAPEERRVRDGDFVVSPKSGADASARALLADIVAGGDVELHIRRPQTLVVGELNTAEGKLGLDLSAHPKSSSVYVRRVLPDGLVFKHNEAHPEAQVKSGDLLVAVNGQKRTAKFLIDMVQSGDRLQLTVVRPHELAAGSE